MAAPVPQYTPKQMWRDIWIGLGLSTVVTVFGALISLAAGNVAPVIICFVLGGFAIMIWGDAAKRPGLKWGALGFFALAALAMHVGGNRPVDRWNGV